MTSEELIGLFNYKLAGMDIEVSFSFYEIIEEHQNDLSLMDVIDAYTEAVKTNAYQNGHEAGYRLSRQ